MYVKSLTMKGFKSFASSTAMRLEPGITCIVGPNGSGKSNVVDALAWVMGEQGAKTLRGGKMEDVIFAGTAARPPLGRAEVSLTIDNTDGALPIDYTEVTLSRTMFRNGGSDYAINATPCRLLDIQELLSDSGIGREMHVIVGQGQLDAVLRATPEDRRGFIEEAAGVLKHRKRKERALRKLDAMEANLTRISDLTGEIRRQLGPLGRQAETARRAAVVQADARDARLRLLADDLVQLTSTVEQEVADESALLAQRHLVEADSAAARERLETLEAREAQIAPLVGAAAQRWYTLSSVRERVQATGTLAAERQRLLGEAEEQDHAPGRDPQVLLAQAQEARADEQRLQSEVDQAGAALDGAVQARTRAEAEHAQEQVRLAALVRAAADRREGLARLSGQVGAAASRIQTLQTSLDRLRESAQASSARADLAGQEYARLEGSVAAAEEGEEGLDSRYESAERQLLQARSEVEEMAEQERSALAERTSLVARREALELGLAAKDGAGYLLEAEEVPGVIGTVAALLQVEPEHAVALEAALGWAADAVAIESVAGARAALWTLRAEEAGSVRLLVAGATRSRMSLRPPAPAGATWASDLVTSPAELAAAVDELLADVVLVADLEAAGDLVQTHPDLIVVTSDGDVLAASRAAGGGRSVPGELATRAAVEETRSREQDASARAQRARFAVAVAREQAARLELEAGQALDALNESDARMSAVAERLGELAGTVRAARAEHERTQTSIGQAEQELAQGHAAHEDLAARLAAAQDAPDDQEPASDERDRLAQQASQARAGETERRLALRTHEERARALRERVAALEAAAQAEQEGLVRQAERAQRRRRDAAMAASVQRGVALAEPMLTRSLRLAAAERDQTERERVEVGVELAAVRRSASDLDARLRELTDSVHRDEVARAQQRMRIEALHARAVDELGIDPEALVEGYGPHQLVSVVPDPQAPADAEVSPQAAYVREVQEKRLRGAERKLAQLGRVNPLALEEYAALEERHAFLTRQLEDLRGSRRDLLDIVREVDERVQRVFADAFADTAAHFEQVFARLFPGGEGRLILTDPDDMLLTGIEVEARPPGKKIKRLSLLSGGERSLVAVALLVSIFKARPSPFYIMDEVEAALDDANLDRLLTLLEELRDTSQLIVITHQKRTMEIADALYGVTMRGDGVTTIVSQRMRDLVDQPA